MLDIELITSSGIRFIFKGINNKITIINGKSGDYKTFAANTIQDYSNGNIQAQVKISYYENRDIIEKYDILSGYTTISSLAVGIGESLDSIENRVYKNRCIYILDEDNAFFRIHGYERIINNSDSLFILISRSDKKLNNFSYSPSDILNLKEHNSDSIIFETVYSRYYDERSALSKILDNKATYLIEDGKSSVKFINEIFKIDLDNILDAGGKDNIEPLLSNLIFEDNTNFFLLYDYFGIGPEIEYLDKASNLSNKVINRIDWYSFEYYVILRLLLNKSTLSLNLEDFKKTIYDFKKTRENFAENLLKVLIGSYRKGKPGMLIKTYGGKVQW